MVVEKQNSDFIIIHQNWFLWSLASCAVLEHFLPETFVFSHVNFTRRRDLWFNFLLSAYIIEVDRDSHKNNPCGFMCYHSKKVKIETHPYMEAMNKLRT